VTELYLIPVAFMTSCLAGVIGMGGGVLLIAMMPGLIPAGAIVPLHAITQLASNGSRAAFGWREINWSLIAPVLIGAFAGAAAGGRIYVSLDLHWLPAIIGLFILVVTWLPLPKPGGGGQAALVLLGFYQTGVGMVAGATGPLGGAVLARHNIERDWLVVNTAVYMSINHALKVAAFAILGFSFSPWLLLIAGMIVASTVGSWAGTRLRQYVPQLDFQRWFKILMTLLAVRMIALSLLQPS
jgi:uncharacterized membrane protein YfcA